MSDFNLVFLSGYLYHLKSQENKTSRHVTRTRERERERESERETEACSMEIVKHNKENNVKSKINDVGLGSKMIFLNS